MERGVKNVVRCDRANNRRSTPKRKENKHGEVQTALSGNCYGGENGVLSKGSGGNAAQRLFTHRLRRASSELGTSDYFARDVFGHSQRTYTFRRNRPLSSLQIGVNKGTHHAPMFNQRREWSERGLLGSKETKNTSSTRARSTKPRHIRLVTGNLLKVKNASHARKTTKKSDAELTAVFAFGKSIWRMG
jgi:hypothetical protein